MTQPLNKHLHDFITTAYANAPGVRRWFEAAGITPADIQSVADRHLDEALQAAIANSFRELCRVQPDQIEAIERIGENAGKIIDQRVWK